MLNVVFILTALHLPTTLPLAPPPPFPSCTLFLGLLQPLWHMTLHSKIPGPWLTPKPVLRTIS